MGTRIVLVECKVGPRWQDQSDLIYHQPYILNC